MQFQEYSRQPEPGTPEVAVELTEGLSGSPALWRDSPREMTTKFVPTGPINVVAQSAAGSAVLLAWEPVQ